MGRINKLIDELETLHQQDIKNSAQVYGITALLSSRLQEILSNLAPCDNLLSSGQITKEEIIARYGNYNNAYNAYKQAYGIKCKKGWNGFLKAIQGFAPPLTLEQRVEKLEETVKQLIQILLEKSN